MKTPDNVLELYSMFLGPYLTAEDLAHQKGMAADELDYYSSQNVFIRVDLGDSTVYPIFQFDKAMNPLPHAREIIAEIVNNGGNIPVACIFLNQPIENLRNRRICDLLRGSENDVRNAVEITSMFVSECL